MISSNIIAVPTDINIYALYTTNRYKQHCKITILFVHGITNSFYVVCMKTDIHKQSSSLLLRMRRQVIFSILFGFRNCNGYVSVWWLVFYLYVEKAVGANKGRLVVEATIWGHLTLLQSSWQEL